MNNKIKKILIYLQRYTKTDNLYLAKGGFWIFLATAVSALLGIALTITFTRLVPKDILGQYQLILAFINTFWFLSLPGINTAVMEAVARGKDRSIFVGLKERLRFSLLGSLTFLMIAAYYYFQLDNLVFSKVFILVALLFPAHASFNITFFYYYAKKNFRLPNLFQILIRLLTVSSIILVLFFLQDIWMIMLIYMILNSVPYILIFWWFIKKEKFVGEADQGIIKYGRQLTAINIIPVVLNNVDIFLLTSFLGIEAVAVYVIATKIPNFIKGFLKGLESLFFPKLVGLDSRSFINKFKNINIYIFLAIGIGAAILILPFVMTLLFGDSYRESILLAQVYTLMLAPFFLFHLFSNWFKANKKTRHYFYITNFLYIGSALLVVLALWLFGSLLAVVIARVIAFVLVSAFGFYLLINFKSNNQNV